MYFKVFQEAGEALDEVFELVPALHPCYSTGLVILSEREFCMSIPAQYRQIMFAFREGAQITVDARFELLDAKDEGAGFFFQQGQVTFILKWWESISQWIVYLSGVLAPAGWEDGDEMLRKIVFSS